MQTIEHKIRIQNYRGESDATPHLVVGMTCDYVVKAVDANGGPSVPAGLENVASWRFVLADDWSWETAPQFATTDVAFDATNAAWTIRLDGTRTAEMLSFIDDEAVRTIGCEIVGLDSGGSLATPAYVVQFTVNVRGRRDSGMAPTDPNGGNIADVVDANAKALLGNWTCSGTLEAQAAKTPELYLYDVAKARYVKVSVYNGTLVFD